MLLIRNSTTSARLGYVLERKKMSQHQLSEISGVNDSVITRVIKGQSTLNEKNLIKLTEALKVNPAWLLGYGSDDDLFII